MSENFGYTTTDKVEAEYYEGLSNPRYERHRELLDLIHKTYKEKNTAYGNSFDRSIDRYGFIAALVRMEDKLNRLEQLLLNGKEPNDESAMDTCLDLASYAVMTAMKIESKQ